MPRACSICTHPDRLAIEVALRGGTPLRTIADRWSVSKTALLRHRDSHCHLSAHADQTVPAFATPSSVPHTLAACAAAILTHCVPVEVRERFDATAARLGVPLEEVVAATLHLFVRHLDQCPHSTAGPEG